MANIPLQSISFPGLSDKYTTPVVDNTLTQTGAAADAKKTGDEIGAIKNDLTDLSEKVDSAFATETATGSIASFSDGADDVPVKDLTVAIEPVQDLHGQSSPYPAGGGKNVLDPNIKLTAGTYYGITLSTTDGYKYTFTGTATDSGNITTASVATKDAVILPAGTYYSKIGTLSLYKADGTWLRNQYSGVAFTVDEPFFVKNIYFEIVSGKTFNTNDFLAIEKGSTAPTEWSPYSNICPISGWTGANVTRTGKNLLPKLSATTTTVNGITFTVLDDGTINVNGTSTGVASIDILTNTKNDLSGLLLSGTPQGYNASNCALAVQYWNGGAFSTSVFQTNGTDLTIEESDNIYILLRVASGVTINNVVFRPMARLATKADASYEPYQGETYEVDWTIEAGTVYGGTLDVTTGVLTVDRAVVDLGTLDWSKDTNRAGVFYANVATKAEAKTGAYIDENWLICDTYKYINESVTTEQDKYVSDYPSYGGKVIFARDTTYTESAEFNTGVSGHYVAYKLATLQTYQLTPQEVSTVLGQNNIFVDCGSVTVQYRADTKLYIDKVVNA